LKINIKAKKRFGQNFLKNEIILQKIVQTIPNDNYIVEIGSGLGDLTKYLLQLSKVTSFEIDRDLEIYLKDKFSKEIYEHRLNLINSDVLNYWSNTNLYSKDYNLVANLPYNVATKIILKALKDNKCKVLIVLIQKEVAQKFCASVGDKEFSSLSILAQSIAEVSILFDIAPENFEPVPKVNSSVIKIQKIAEPNIEFSTKEFENFLKICFMQPRKTIYKNLSMSYSKEYILLQLEKYEIPSTHRPHQIDIKKYHLLYKNLKANRDTK
jgi:16S rRNA (adenine1518-N6/adenine1519-N6)-dimethyltransferase